MVRYLPLSLGQVQVGQAVAAVQHGFDPELLMNSICPMLEELGAQRIYLALEVPICVNQLMG